MSKLSTVTITLSKAEYSQVVVDIEQAIEELTTLCIETSWFCSEMPERLLTVLEMLRQKDEDA